MLQADALSDVPQLPVARAAEGVAGAEGVEPADADDAPEADAADVALALVDEQGDAECVASFVTLSGAVAVTVPQPLAAALL
jgi:hypothetical protein